MCTSSIMKTLEASLHGFCTPPAPAGLAPHRPTVGGGVHLGVIDKAVGINVAAGLALAARLGSHTTTAIVPHS